VLGAFIGTFMGYVFPHHSAPIPVYVMIGMGAFLAGTTHAPIMAILMIFEMTREYSVVLPLMLACVIANYVAQAIQPDSIYSDSLRRKTSEQEASPEYFL
jgi:CIC family chloride channel protein